MKKIKFLILLFFGGLAIFGLMNGSDFVPVSEASSAGPPAGFSGAPDESSCTACHGSATGVGQFSIVAPPRYAPGQTYEVQVKHATTDTTRVRWGFQLSPRTVGDVAVGSFTNTTTNTSTVNSDGRTYVQQTLAGTFNGQTGGATWTFNWTAPSSYVGAVKFYAAGNQANGVGVTGDQIYTTNSTILPLVKNNYDFDGDSKADVAVFRPSTGIWYSLNSQSGFSAVQFGASGDKLVPADYDGDGKTDIAVYRSGTWYLSRSSLGIVGVLPSSMGLSTADPSDIPQPADVDGDGKSELVIFRAANGTWYSYNLANNQRTAVQFGQNGDQPVIGDYDGDGKADIAVFRPSNGTWYINRSQLGFIGIQFGASEDKAVPADYDGDGKTDIAVFRPSSGTWFVQRSTAGFLGVQFGASTDAPSPGDYDGDGKADVAVFRPSNGVWYINRSQSGLFGVQFGATTDLPVSNSFVR